MPPTLKSIDADIDYSSVVDQLRPQRQAEGAQFPRGPRHRGRHRPRRRAGKARRRQAAPAAAPRRLPPCPASPRPTPCRPNLRGRGKAGRAAAGRSAAIGARCAARAAQTGRREIARGAGRACESRQQGSRSRRRHLHRRLLHPLSRKLPRPRRPLSRKLPLRHLSRRRSLPPRRHRPRKSLPLRRCLRPNLPPRQSRPAPTAKIRRPIRMRRSKPNCTSPATACASNFPSPHNTPAAIFRRADTLWLVFDSEAHASTSPRSSATPATPSAKRISSAARTAPQIVRIRLDRPRLTSVVLDDGPAWIVDVGDTVVAPTKPLAIARSIAGQNRASIAIPFDDARKLHRITDPEVGDRLMVITGAGAGARLPQGAGFRRAARAALGAWRGRCSRSPTISRPSSRPTRSSSAGRAGWRCRRPRSASSSWRPRSAP